MMKINLKEFGNFDYCEFINLEEINRQMLSTPVENRALMAFRTAAGILNIAFSSHSISYTDFKLESGGHMVRFKGYTSYGNDPEASKARIKADRQDVIDVEFYLRHALMATEHWSHKRRMPEARRPAA